MNVAASIDLQISCLSLFFQVVYFPRGLASPKLCSGGLGLLLMPEGCHAQAWQCIAAWTKWREVSQGLSVILFLVLWIWQHSGFPSKCALCLRCLRMKTLCGEGTSVKICRVGKAGAYMLVKMGVQGEWKLGLFFHSSITFTLEYPSRINRMRSPFLE